MMTLASTVLPLLLFLCQIVLHSAHETKQGRVCPPFTCGGFKDVGFPFSSVHNPECGPWVMSCTGPEAKEAKVQFHEKGKLYHVDYFNYTARLIGIHDEDVLLHLNSNRCDLLSNFNEQVPPFLSIRVTKTIELFKCKKSGLHPISLPKFFDLFDNNTSCIDYDLYFYNDRNRHLPPLPDTLFNHCSVVHAPYSKQKLFDLGLKKDNHTSTWFSDFTLLWQTSHECLNCTQKGGRCQSSRNCTFECGTFNCLDCNGNASQCVSTQNGTFECRTSKTPNEGVSVGRKVGRGVSVGTKVGIGVGAGIGGILVTCIVFILYQRRKRNKLNSSSALLFRDISGDPSVKPYFKQGSIYFQTPEFTYKELEKATNHFDSNNELGDGGFGTVYHGKLRDGRVVAVKRLFEHNHKRVEQFMNEVIILSRLHHQNLVSLYGCTNRKCQELLLVYEYVPNGTVADHLHGDRATAGLLTWPIRMSIAIETADALTYLHASDIIHRDVKSSNILLDNGFHVKVADFGLSRLFPSNITHVSTAPQGTPGYVDPEYHQCYQLNDKSDVYSFGVVLIELISSKPAVDIGRPRHEINLANMALNKIHNRALHELVDPSLGFDSDYSTRNMITLVAELAFRCLQEEKEMRPHMIEVLEILRGIESAYKMQKADGMTISAESRIKNSEPFSPDSVTDKWVSKFSTPNTSG